MPDALEVAAAQDRQFKRTGRLVGPLHGVVMAIKDQYDTFDMRTTSGADAQYANDRPPDDATFVKRLRDAGAIVLAKANMAEYATDGGRSAFGGTFCNPYDTERVPGMSSAGSASSVAANLVTCAIAEETVVSIRWPAAVNNLVGLAPTQELVSRDGMMGAGLNTRTGPICRTVQDAAKVLDVIAGYDPKDELTVFAVGRKPARPYASFAAARTAGRRAHRRRSRIHGQDAVRQGGRREHRHHRACARRSPQTRCDARGSGTRRARCSRGASIATRRSSYNAAFAAQRPNVFPPQTDQIATLLEMDADPARVPAGLSIRNFGVLPAQGEAKYMIDKYLRERGDANIKTNADLVSKARFYQDPNFPDRKQQRENIERQTALDTSTRLQSRFAMQTIVLQCMQEQKIDALVSPTATDPRPEAGRAAGAERERPASDRLVAPRAAGISGDHGARGFHDDGVGSRARRRGDAPGRTDAGEAPGRRRLHRPSLRRAAPVPHRVRVRGRYQASLAAARFRIVTGGSVNERSRRLLIGCTRPGAATRCRIFERMGVSRPAARISGSAGCQPWPTRRRSGSISHNLPQRWSGGHTRSLC